MLRKEGMVHTKRFLGSANLQRTHTRRKCLLHRSSVKRNMLSLSISCVRTSSNRQKKNLVFNATRIGFGYLHCFLWPEL